MTVKIDIEGANFLINDTPTYGGRMYHGRPIEGLLFNSRMIQAIFDDENPETRCLWAYPDTGEWDPKRNTDEFCATLPEYRWHGVLAVTVGLQGGGSIYRPDVYDHYISSAYERDGTFRPPYFERLRQVLAAADRCGMIVIVNYFYWKQAARLEGNKTVENIIEKTTEWLLNSGYTNILIDIMNEAGVGHGVPELLTPDGIHRSIEVAQQIRARGRRLLIGASTEGGDNLPKEKWAAQEDISMPHGNGCIPSQLAAKLRCFKQSEVFKKRPRPVLINEDSIFIENLEAAVEEGCSWGFYCQGFGSDTTDRFDWSAKPRESSYADLSGFQTLPVNWNINTDRKRAFFEKTAEITGATDELDLD